MELDEHILEELRTMKVGKHIKIVLPNGDLIETLDELYLGYKLRLAYVYAYDLNKCIFQKTEYMYGDYIGPDAIGIQTNEEYMPH